MRAPRSTDYTSRTTSTYSYSGYPYNSTRKSTFNNDEELKDPISTYQPKRRESKGFSCTPYQREGAEDDISAVGLSNIGNTCFMYDDITISGIQCSSVCSPRQASMRSSSRASSNSTPPPDSKAVSPVLILSFSRRR